MVPLRPAHATKRTRLALVFQALDDFNELSCGPAGQGRWLVRQNQQIRVVDERLREATRLLHALGIGLMGRLRAGSSSTSLSAGQCAGLLPSGEAKDFCVETGAAPRREKTCSNTSSRQITDALGAQWAGARQCQRDTPHTGRRQQSKQDVEWPWFCPRVRPEKAEHFAVFTSKSRPTGQLLVVCRNSRW